MKVHSFYDVTTGLFTGATFTTSLGDPKAHEEALAINTPAGCAHIEGKHDHLSRRVDPSSGQVVDYQPPQPSEDHAWNADARRWLIKPEVLQAQFKRDQAIAQIAELERRQARPVRELLLSPANADARSRLQAIEDQIAGLRTTLSAQ